MLSIEVGKLAEPLTKLIDVVSQGVGKIYQPFATVLDAKAAVKAELILAQGDIEKQDLTRRAAIRLAHVEAERQRNIESVVDKAQKALPAAVSSAPVDKDWINHYFSSVADVSAEDLQTLWAKILAGEVTAPGTYSRRLLETLKSTSKDEAEMFGKFLPFTFKPEDGWRYVVTDPVVQQEMTNAGVHGGWLRHFVDIGLLASESNVWTASKITGVKFAYGGRKFVFSGPPPPPQKGPFSPLEMIVGFRSLTSIGQQLSVVAAPSKVGPIDLITKLNAALAKLEVSIDEEPG